MAKLSATHTGTALIGDAKMDCAVLDSERRVFTEEALAKAVQRTGRPHKKGCSTLSRIVGAKNLLPFGSAKLKSAPLFRFKMPSGQWSQGYEVTVLADICDIYVAAWVAGKLYPQQVHIARRCVQLQSGFARLGLVAIADEATGYQQARRKDALQQLLPEYLRDTPRSYKPEYPEELFRHIYRLRGWKWKGNNRHPQCMGGYINWLFYGRMVPGMREELCRRNPSDGRGRRARKHHQFLSDEEGRDLLLGMIPLVLSHAQVAVTWEGFKRAINIALPPIGQQPPEVAAVIAEQLYLAGFEPSGD